MPLSWFWNKRAGADKASGSGGTTSAPVPEPDRNLAPARFQLVPDSAFHALGQWGSLYLQSSLFLEHVVPLNTIELPEAIAAEIRADGRAINDPVEAYVTYVTRLVREASERSVTAANAKLNANWTEPASGASADPVESRLRDKWNAEFEAQFRAALAALFKDFLAPKISAGELPLSSTTLAALRKRNNKTTSAGAVLGGPVADNAQSTTQKPTEGYDRAMCYITYKSDRELRNILSPLVEGALTGRLTGDISGDASVGPLLLPMRSATVAVMLVDAPLPLPAISDDQARFLGWSSWRIESLTWRRHAIVTALSNATSLPEARALAEEVIFVAAALAEKSGARGVEWVPSVLFYPAAEFVRRALSRPLPPELLFRLDWRGYLPPAGPGLGATTRGLRSFGLPEFDCPPTGEKPDRIYHRLMNLSSYLLANGMVLNDGDTIGFDEQRQARIRHSPDTGGLFRLIIEPI
jgi:hypothetical protein